MTKSVRFVLSHDKTRTKDDLFQSEIQHIASNLHFTKCNIVLYYTLYMYIDISNKVICYVTIK